ESWEDTENCVDSPYTLSFTLPATGGPWIVTGFDVEYDMTSTNIAYINNQRSYIYFQNADVAEEVYSRNESGEGTATYTRTVDIANGSYADGAELVFEMRAWRTWGTDEDCGVYYVKVDDGTWKITLHY